MLNELKKIASYKHEPGSKQLIARIQKGLWRHLYYEVFYKPSLKTFKKNIPNLNSLILQTIDSSQMSFNEWCDNIQKIKPIYPTLEYKIRNWFDSGDILTIGYIGRSIMWRSRLTTNDWLFNYLPKYHRESSIYHTDLYVPKPFRNKGIAQAALFLLEKIAYEHQWEKIWAFVRTHKQASLKLHKKTKYQYLGHIIFSEILFQRSVWLYGQDGAIQKLFFNNNEDADK